VVEVADEIERSDAVVSQAIASQSMMQERERRRASVSTISGKRCVRSCLHGCRAARAAPSCGQ
jgi:hypothetical protein